MSSAFYYLFAAIVFLIPTSLVAAELAAMFQAKQGGVFRWVGEAYGKKRDVYKRQAYETVEKEDHSLPLLTPMSEVAGRMATQVGARFLEKPQAAREN